MNRPWIAKRRLWFTKEIEPTKEVKKIEAVSRPTMSVKKVKIHLAERQVPKQPSEDADLSLMAKQAIAELMNVPVMPVLTSITPAMYYQNMMMHQNLLMWNYQQSMMANAK